MGAAQMRDGGPSEHGPEALSAWLDGESNDFRADFDSLVASTEGRRLWTEYHLIGDVLRSEALASGGDLTARVMSRLELEPAIVAAPKRPEGPPRSRRWARRYAMPGVAAAAAVAAITWGVVPRLSSDEVRQREAQVAVQVAPATPVQVSAERPSARQDATMPVVVQAASPQQIDPYLIAHQQSIFAGAQRSGGVQPVSLSTAPTQ